MELRSSWKDGQSAFFDELKNTLARTRREHSKTAQAEKDGDYLRKICQDFEEFMEKFTVSYFSCTEKHNGYFLWNEPESVFVSVLSHSRDTLNHFHANLRPTWSRKNIFIQFDAHESLSDSLINNYSCFNHYFPRFIAPSLAHADKLAFALHFACTKDSLECPGMQLLGKGGWLLLRAYDSRTSNVEDRLCLAKSLFSGHSKWPFPICLTAENWQDQYPVLNLCVSDEETRQKNISFARTISFDQYVVYVSPGKSDFAFATAENVHFSLTITTINGPVPIGFGHVFSASMSGDSSCSISHSRTETSNQFLVLKIMIGPMNYDKFVNLSSSALDAVPKLSLDGLKQIPQFYDHFFGSWLGEAEWSRQLRLAQPQAGPRICLPLPLFFLEAKGQLRSLSKHKCKTDLTLLVDRAEHNSRRETNLRHNFYQPVIFPPIRKLKDDFFNINRLLDRFKFELAIFSASCNPSTVDDGGHKSQFQLPDVIFKHCLTTQQMTDYTEAMRKRQVLRSLFTEQEPDLLYLLKQNPQFSDDLDATYLVSGDIFGNPFKKYKKSKRAKRRQSEPLAASIEPIIEASEPESEPESENMLGADDGIVAESSHSLNELEDVVSQHNAIDEIDYIYIEDVGAEIVSDGSIVSPMQFGRSRPASVEPDMEIVTSLVRSPGGMQATRQLQESVCCLEDTLQLLLLKSLCQRYKRHQLLPIIEKRLSQVQD